jgi:CheY-like chemotaxis protein
LTSNEGDGGHEYTSSDVGFNISALRRIYQSMEICDAIHGNTVANIASRTESIGRFGHARPDLSLRDHNMSCLSIASRLLNLAGRQVLRRTRVLEAK